MDISIIIPVYNAEEYITESLESVRKNIGTLQVEVFLIDDGSTDKSTDIARFYAENCKEFSYFRVENGGPGKARNFGVTMASGKYLYFMDADDILVEGTLSKMFFLAEKNRTDLTICNVARIQGKTITASGLHVRAFCDLKDNVTHIKKHPNLVYDTISCNKLILRSFFNDNRLMYPEGCAYEDIPLTLQMYYIANNVSVMRNTGYIWRIRSSGGIQLTRVLDKKALVDRIAILTQTITFIKEHVKETQILREFQIKALDLDFELFLDRMHLLSPDEAKEFMDLISCFINKYIDKTLLNKIPLKKQQLIKDVLDGNLDHLIRVVNYKNINYSKAPVIETNNALELNLPEDIFTIKNRDIDNEFLNTAPNCFIDFVTTEGSKVFINGHLYYWRVSLPEETSQKITSCVLNEETGFSVPLVICPFKCEYLTEEQGKLLNYDDYKFYDYNYDGAGFQIILDFEKLETCPALHGTNYIILSFENRISSGAVLLKGIKQSAKRCCEDFRYTGINNTGTITFDKQNIININFDITSDAGAENKPKKPGDKNYTKDTLVFERMKELEQLNRKLNQTNQTLKQTNQKLGQTNQKLKQSRSYKLGRALTWLPRKIRDMF